MTLPAHPAPHPAEPSARARRVRTPALGWRAWLELTKPKIVLLMLITCLCSMLVAEQGLPALDLLMFTIGGLALAIGGASTLNHVLDRDIDAQMARTAMRPIVVGTISVRGATAFGIALTLGGGAVLLAFVSPLAAACAVFGGLFYDFIYTPLKRVTVHNTVLGGVAGAMPPLVGWVAVTGGLDSVLAWTLFAIMFLWQPAHFWPLSLLIQREYAAAGIKMMPALHGERATVRATWRWTWLTVVATFVPVATGDAGWVYAAGAVIANAFLVRRMWALVAVDRARGADEAAAEPLVGGSQPEGRVAATRAFLGSTVWLALIFIALVVDALT